MDATWLSERNQRLFHTEQPVAFVTGSAANRVGRRIATMLLDCGFRVVFHSRTRQSENIAFVESLAVDQEKKHLVFGDVSEEHSVDQWLAATIERWGRVDVVVNSASVWQPISLEKTDAQEMRRQWEVNTLATFLTSRRFGLQMVQQPSGGCIINIGDWAVARPYSEFAAYFASKGSIETVTRSLAVELASRNPNVRVNAILPGPVLLAEGITEDRQQKIIQDSLLKRAGTANDVAEAAYFLATSPFVTGISLPVDGGRSIFSGISADCIAHPDAGPPNA